MKYIGENAIKKLISLIKGDLATKQDSIAATGVLERDTTGVINGVETVGATLVETQEAKLVDVPNGLLKGDGTTISAAVAGTDYVVPSTALNELPGHIANGDIHVTAEQKTAWNGTVRYDAAQTLTDAQKTQARNNIGAANLDTQNKVLAKTIPIKQISLTAAELQGFLDGLPRLLTDVYYITFTGELTERLTLSGFYGGGGINILGTAQGESKLSGGVTCHSCSAGVAFQKCTISVSSGESALASKYGSIVDIDECAVSGGSQGCLSLMYDGIINVRNGCSFSGGAYVVVLSISGTAVFHVAEGDSYTCPGGIWIWHGGGYIISAAGTLI